MAPAAVSGDNATTAISIFDGTDAVLPTVSHLRVTPSVKVISPATCLHCVRLTQVEMPEGLKTIGSRAFSCCQGLKMIGIPSTVTVIGERVFQNCCNLKSIILPQGLSKLGEESFQGCCSLETIHIPPLIQTIETGAFSGCTSLTEVLLPPNLQLIEESAFQRCESLTSIAFPSSLQVIGKLAFHGAGLTEFNRPNSVEDCGSFKDCKFQNLRMPPLITKFDSGIFEINGGNKIMSIELPENVQQVVYSDPAFPRLPMLRNIAFPVGCSVHIGDMEREDRVNLSKVVYQSQRRFDDLPLHKICYYHSYHDPAKVLADMNRIIHPRSTKSRLGKFSAIGNRQDCHGMTPLHILSCSTKHYLEMFHLIVEKYPENLVATDKWGEIPLSYAFWCSAPTEVIDFLSESFKTHHPDYKIDWEDMVATAVMRAPLPRIQIVLDTLERRFPDAECNLKFVAMRLANTMDQRKLKGISGESFRFFLRTTIARRLDLLNVKRWIAMIEHAIKFMTLFQGDLEEKTWYLYSVLEEFESWKESTSLLELALWKVSLADQKAQVVKGRNLCRVHCGAEIVIRNVVPFLWSSIKMYNDLPPEPSYYDCDY